MFSILDASFKLNKFNSTVNLSLAPKFRAFLYNFNTMFTNKLKKTLPSDSPKRLGISSGRQITLSTQPVALLGAAIKQTDPPKPFPSSEKIVRPQTPGEQYWAARAIKAEALLSARLAHNRELRTQSMSEETKRAVSCYEIRTFEYMNIEL